MDQSTKTDIRVDALLAEFFATFLFIFATVMAIEGSRGSIVVAALAFGGVIAVMIATFGRVSGAHMNPAVTVALWATKRLDNLHAGLYVVIQFVAAAAAALLAEAILPSHSLALSTTKLVGDVTLVGGLAVEVLLTFMLVFVVFAVAVDPRAPSNMAAGLIGLTVAVAVVAGGPMTGAALNPARWFGPALADGVWDNVILYTAGPLLGGLLAALLYERYFLPKHDFIDVKDAPAGEEE